MALNYNLTYDGTNGLTVHIPSYKPFADNAVKERFEREALDVLRSVVRNKPYNAATLAEANRLIQNIINEYIRYGWIQVFPEQSVSIGYTSEFNSTVEAISKTDTIRELHKRYEEAMERYKSILVGFGVSNSHDVQFLSNFLSKRYSKHKNMSAIRVSMGEEKSWVYNHISNIINYGISKYEEQLVNPVTNNAFWIGYDYKTW